MKETFYFSHDYHARDDEKSLYLISKCGYFGYGVFWSIIEHLHQSSDGKIKINLIEGLSHKLNISTNEFNTVITACTECELLKIENNFLFSNRVLRNKKELQKYRENKSKAGKLGMQKRWNIKKDNNTVITENNNTITKHNKVKESKVNKSKINYIKEDTNKQSSDCGQVINNLLKEFEIVNPTINYGNKTQRGAMEELLKKLGEEKLRGTILYAVSVQGKQYAPTITTPYQLKENLGKLLIYHKRETEPKKGGVTILQ